MDRTTMAHLKSDVQSVLQWFSESSLIRVSQAQPRTYSKHPPTSWAKQSKLNEIPADQVYMNSFGSINLP